jgi:hypothetical protein
MKKYNEGIFLGRLVIGGIKYPVTECIGTLYKLSLFVLGIILGKGRGKQQRK